MIYASLGILVIILVIIILKGLKNELTVSTYQIENKKVNQAFTFLFLSDLHSSKFGENQEELLNTIKKQKPDLILFGGDIVDDRKPEKLAYLVLEECAKIAPCFYVTGNHEGYTARIDEIRNHIQSLGVEVLAGNKIDIQIRTQGISIIGVDDPYRNKKGFERQLDKLATYVNPRFTLFLAHRPEYFKQYQNIQSDLILSGHAHGGQWRIPIFNQGVFAPGQGLLPKYTSGFYRENNATMFVSRGLSYDSTRVPRFNNPPELIVIDVVPKHEQEGEGVL